MSDLQLETPRLCLRLIRSSDLDDLLKIFGDPKVTASFGGATFNREQNVLHLPRLISLIRVGNAASRRVSEKKECDSSLRSHKMV